MLKASGSTKSITRTKKSGVRVCGDSGRDSGDDCGHDDEHSPRGLGRAYQQTRQLVRPGLWSNMMRLIEIGVILLASQLKVEELSKVKKPQRFKSYKGYWLGKRFTKTLIYRQRTRASIRALTGFHAIFADLWAPLIPRLEQLLIK